MHRGWLGGCASLEGMTDYVSGPENDGIRELYGGYYPSHRDTYSRCNWNVFDSPACLCCRGRTCHSCHESSKALDEVEFPQGGGGYPTHFQR